MTTSDCNRIYDSASSKSHEVLTPLGTVYTTKLTMDGQNMKP